MDPLLNKSRMKPETIVAGQIECHRHNEERTMEAVEHEGLHQN
jgi:hypothetical protein